MKKFLYLFVLISSFTLGQTNTEVYVFDIEKSKNGFETYISLDSLKEGKHILSINRKYINRKRKDTTLRRVVQIPFWKFKK
ncbi:MAG: hypothetical protein HWD82_06565 [Flavobacteriaceae bacterium]|nr:hypothetical protein [Flavobacteriaceae bacterium]